MNHYGVIMAGGGGTRFWPLSRKKTPKQLLNITGKDLMINEAVERISTVIGKSNIFIVTSDIQAPAMITATQGKVFPRNILAEPDARNTSACIGYAAMEILRKYGDGVMIITPADHYIENVQALTDVFREAIIKAEEQDKLITIGLKPTFPSTGYGYIKYDEACFGEVTKAIEFKEKPDSATAKAYIDSGQYVWNSGMFIWKASLILKKIKEFVPDVYRNLEIIGNAMNTPLEQEILHEVYPQIRKISIDYAVMEPSASNGDVLVIQGDFGWNDVGSWDMMNILHKTDKDGNVCMGDIVTVNVKDSVLYSSSRTVTAVDVSNVVIVETSDAIMVCKKDNAQNVKEIVDKLDKAGRIELL
ncbi:MAG: mannose-1-phosphate guanylyltransferase [Lachnospiraceae bacterium]|nr:mannose-1-phosphate guanylyltransferase [Lachnospiraceae bacterium]